MKKLIFILLLIPVFGVSQIRTVIHRDTTFTINGTDSSVYTVTPIAVLIHTHTFSSLTSKPTTLSGYGITDNVLLSNGSAASLTNFPTLNQNTSGTAAGLSAVLSFTNGGIGAGAATSATTGTMTVTMNTEMITITPTAACTFNASGGVTGQRATFVITTSGVSSFVLTWGTNFKTVGTLATGTITAKKFCVSFLCLDGTTWLETGRTAAM